MYPVHRRPAVAGSNIERKTWMLQLDTLKFWCTGLQLSGLPRHELGPSTPNSTSFQPDVESMEVAYHSATMLASRVVPRIIYGSNLLRFPQSDIR